MAIRYFCDRCQKEVGSSSLVPLQLGTTYNARKWELCSNCVAELQGQFMQLAKGKDA